MGLEGARPGCRRQKVAGGELRAEEQEPAVGEADDTREHRRWVVQSQGPAGGGGLLRSVEERVESAAVAEGDEGEVDVDGADAVAQAPLQGRAHQGRRFQVDLTDQGDQCPCPSVMAVDGELRQVHDASVQRTIRQRLRWRRDSGHLSVLPAGAYVQRRQSEAGPKARRAGRKTTRFPPGMRRVTDHEPAPRAICVEQRQAARVWDACTAA